MSFRHNLRQWPVLTLTYIEKFDSVMATGQINLPDVQTMTFGHKLRHWPIVTLTYIEQFDSVTATGQINLPAVSLLSFILYSHKICLLTEAMKDA